MIKEDSKDFRENIEVIIKRIASVKNKNEEANKPKDRLHHDPCSTDNGHQHNPDRFSEPIRFRYTRSDLRGE